MKVKPFDTSFALHFQMLTRLQRNTRKEAVWMVSNIAAGTEEQIDRIFKEPGLLDKIIDMATKDEFIIKKEAIWTLTNICTSGNEFQVRNLVNRRGLQPIIDILTAHDCGIVLTALDGIDKVLSVGEKDNLGYTTLIDEYGGIDLIEDLQENLNEDIYCKAVAILEKYFGIDDEEDENLAPTQIDGTYGFGISQPISKQLFPDDTNMATSPIDQSKVSVFGSSNGNSMF